MKELKNDTHRLMAALAAVADDDYTIQRLAHYLNYLPSKLKEDIQSADEYISALEKNERA